MPIREHSEPEVGALALGQLQAEHLLVAVQVQRQMGRTSALQVASRGLGNREV